MAIGTLALAFATVGLALATLSLVGTTDEEMRLVREQTEALKTQADIARSQVDDRVRELHRAQAELIAAAMGPLDRSAAKGDPTAGRTGIDLFNTSPSPVYGLVIAIVVIQGTGPNTTEEWLELRAKTMQPMPITTTNTLPPGNFRIWVRGTGWSSALSGRSGAEVAFTDRAGKHWIRRANGQLGELTQAPLEYFKRWGLYGPYDFETPERV